MKNDKRKKQSLPNEKVKNSDDVATKRAEWLSKLDIAEKQELLFELELNLKGLDRFFNLNNHSFSSFESLISRNFISELDIVYRAVNRIVIVTGELLHQKAKNIFYFQRFILGKLMEDFTRDVHIKKELKQNTPEESLHFLRLAFINLRNILSALVQLGAEIQYNEFNSIGQLITREVASNKFFNPFDNKPFVVEFDKILIPQISEIIFGISHSQLRKKTSIIYLSLYRLLHYLAYIDATIEDYMELKSYLLYFGLINSEYKVLLHFIENEFIPCLNSISGPISLKSEKRSDQNAKSSKEVILPVKLRDSTESLIYQLRMELRNINQRVLRNLIHINEEHRLRSTFENATGILTNLIQQIVVYISQEFNPHIRGEEIFTVFVSRLKQSLRLRRDIWVFKEVMSHYEEKVETLFDADTLEIYKEYFEKLSEYIKYFKWNSVVLLRYDDALDFQKFFDTVESCSLDDLETSYKLESFKLSAKYFKIFLETMLGNIANRNELRNHPLDVEDANSMLNKYIHKGS
ncbi:hypothetical protein ACFL27_20135 [candidate division CSSED10-310 bacterium]|uniref:Uncharacterized protein n=1 Tax=candidate division CSSED10-310 bacterium TaxID=2855610 RepID=A0ABV6Z228_UNCC1